MRKDRYAEQFAEHMPGLRKIAMHAGLDGDEADEVLSKCSENLLNNKRYTTIKQSGLKGFLRTAVRFEVQHYKQSELSRRKLTARLPDLDEGQDEKKTVEVIHTVNIDVQEIECPFCFKANLNEYGACAMCHTIIPSHIRLQRHVLVTTKESLAVEFDFNTKIDVHKAIARLNPLEQKVVIACGLGNESLESFALDSEVSKSYLVRIWGTAKTKLQDYLHEYADDNISKRGANAFRKALKGINSDKACPNCLK